MSVDQGRGLAERATTRSPQAAQARYDRATVDLDPPLAIVDLGAFDRNAADMTRRAALAGNGGRPIRVATKSLRCRYLIGRALATPGYRGVMCYSLAEALWLHAMGTSDDLLVAYPTVDRRALSVAFRARRTGGAPRARAHRLVAARRLPGSVRSLNLTSPARGRAYAERAAVSAAQAAPTMAARRTSYE